ncbi:hypothetical protein VSDG_01722 [Cytospora chrysosperma]|uniref:Mid2 domain-containing protein n=1 Tax=Cytospora chrysosperma TaxID=252740 RepID=A0A423WHA5_CYTCH|nr:hypothetical protein VSDG_01722 [Valsa sordida]
MAETPFLTTISGTATSFLPLPSAWPSAGADCAQAIYQQIAGHFLGWDPWYAHYIDSGLETCWPPEASSWWNQDASSTTSLGTTFVCPGAYHAAYTSSVDSQTTRTICCPSGYNLYVAEFAKPTFPSQCTSTLTAGETLSWEKIYYESGMGNTWAPTTTTVQSEILTVFGVPVNGLNVIATSTTISSTATDTSSETISPAGMTTMASAASSSTPSRSSSSSGGASVVGIAVGASVGAIVGVLLVALIAFFVWRRRHAGRGPVPDGSTGSNSHDARNSNASSFDTSQMRHVRGYHVSDGQHAHELRGSHPATHELPVDRHNSLYELPDGEDGRN